MIINLNEPSMLPIYERIVHQTKDQIARGILRQGDKIPSVRELSASLLINPNTVSKAYQELERQGVILTIRGKGTFVAEPAASPGMERERLELLRSDLKRIVVEARHLGMSRARLLEWIGQEVDQYWGNEHVDSNETE